MLSLLRKSKETNQQIKNPLNEEEMKFLEKLKQCKVREGAYHYYIKNIHNRQNETYENVCKLLARDILLGKMASINHQKPHRKLFYYGNLSIMYNEVINEIVWINNTKGVKIDKNKKKWLNQELKITR